MCEHTNKIGALPCVFLIVLQILYTSKKARFK